MKFYSILLVILIVKITDFKISAQDSGDYLVSNEANLSLKNTVSKPAYEYKVHYYKNQLDKISDEEAGEHFLGEMIAKKFYLFEKKYLYSTYTGSSNSKTKTAIHKPIIFEAVKDIEHHMMRMVKKGEMIDMVAEEHLNIILDVAIIILTQETTLFENELESCRRIESKIVLFTEYVKLNYL